ncbi:803_t:CDS:2 [Paraglomus occultum]|uniref:803_t:CDS:1 n=1 Tax=Paraglomus occultum TaxID=144539 RepID=A0A9N8ZCJ6_9GLOM|nr:803_t:CDS:2 [Paraglomus occultum]
MDDEYADTLSTELLPVVIGFLLNCNANRSRSWAPHGKIFPSLVEFDLFTKLSKRDTIALKVNIPPSELADTRKFIRFQNEDDPLALNYRPAGLTGLPVSLCNDILAKFQDNANGSIELVEEDIVFVRNLSNEMCSIFDDEAERRDCFHKLVGRYFSRVFDIHTFGNKRGTDGSLMFTKGNFQVPLLNLEVKPELGMGSGCPYVQSTAYYVEFIKKLKDSNSSVITQSRFPVFLMYLAGPYLGVAGAVFLTTPVCEPLTPVMPLFYRPHHEDMLLRTACVLKALKIALNDLEIFYDQLSHDSNIKLSQQISFPYISKMNIGQVVANIIYVKKLDRYIFQAKMEHDNGLSQHVIVKFAKRYSEECHSTCQGLGIAPRLFSCKWIPGGWCVVVMEQLMGYGSLSSLAQDKKLSIQKKTMESVKKMHNQGFVHGDMRLSNIMTGPNDSVKIIDFDWSGKVGEAVYPPLLNPDIDWHPDVKAGAKILPDHDLYMLNNSFNSV